MSTHTIKVSGVSDSLLKLLDERIRRQHALGRSEYIRELIRKDVVPIETSSVSVRSFREIVGPVHVETARLGVTEAEADDLIEAIRADRFADRAERFT